MVENKATVDAIVKILLKRLDKEAAHRMARDLYSHVHGTKSLTDMFLRIAKKLEEDEE